MPPRYMSDGQDFDHGMTAKFMGMPATQQRAKGGNASKPVRRAASQAAVGRANMARSGMPGLGNVVSRRPMAAPADMPGAAMSIAAQPRPAVRGAMPPSRMQMPGTAPTMKDGGMLSTKQRQAMPKSDFALPGKGTGKMGKGPGSYPIPDASHARNALARVSQHGTPAEKATVRSKVHSKFPGIKMAKAEGGAVDMAQDKRMIASAMRKDQSEDKRMIDSAMRKDEAEDKRMIKSAVGQHETQEHGGKHSTIKLAKGGRAAKKGVPCFAKGGIVGKSLPTNQRPPQNPNTRTLDMSSMPGGVLAYGVQPSTERSPGESQMYGNALKKRTR